VLPLGYVSYAITLAAVVWFLNLFNFMDGIDGLAISEAIFMSFGAGALAALNGAPVGVVLAMLALGAACLGFLPLNWPPARVFMGDAGSGFLGYLLGIFALATIVAGTLSVWTWILLSGTFLIDATATLVRRWVRGESVHQAHRSHAYQQLARKWKSHRRVTLLYGAVNLFWLLPLAWLSTRWSAWAAPLAVLGTAPLFVAARRLGAGDPTEG
jgi:Fuc2NAc and GlcNAc transferase